MRSFNSYKHELKVLVVVVYNGCSSTAYSMHLIFLLQAVRCVWIDAKLALLQLSTGNSTDGPSVHVTTKEYMNEFVTHKLCVLSSKKHAQHHAIFTLVAMSTMSVFGAIIVVYLIVLFCCLCRRLVNSSCCGQS